MDELSQPWGAFRRDLWLKVAPCWCSRPERRLFASEAALAKRLLQKDAEESLPFQWPSQWELGTSKVRAALQRCHHHCQNALALLL